MEKKKYIAPKAGNAMMLLEGMITTSITNATGTANVGLGSGDPGAEQGAGSAASRGSFWDDSE